VSLASKNMANTTSWVLHITSASRYQMHMAVEDSPTSDFAAIHAIIETFNR
jgi:hypothetical protein